MYTVSCKASYVKSTDFTAKETNIIVVNLENIQKTSNTYSQKQNLF